MSTFSFSLDDLLALDQSDSPVLDQMKATLPFARDGTKDQLTTSASSLGLSQSMDVLGIGSVMMGVPVFNDEEHVLGNQEQAFTQLLAGSLVGQQRSNGEVLNISADPSNGFGFNAENIIPADILADSKQLAQDLGPISDGSQQGVPGGGEGGLLPPDVLASDAYKHTSTTGPPASKFVQIALMHQGDKYDRSGQIVRGITHNPNQHSFDCSGLVWWALNQCGSYNSWPTSSGPQYRYCQSKGTNLPTIDMGIRSRGALLFRGPDEHVAISLGNNTTMEANSSSRNRPNAPYGGGGVLIMPNASGRKWTQAALIPELNYQPQVNGGTAAGGGPGAGAFASAGSSVFVGQQSNSSNIVVLAARMNWAKIFLGACAFPITRNNVISVVAWQEGENTNANFNPLATTETWPKAPAARTSTDFNRNNGSPVQNYLNAGDGFAASKWALTHGPALQYYRNIIASLQASADPHVTLSFFAGGPGQGRGTDLNTWGTGHLPFGKIDQVTRDLANAPIP